MSQLTKRLKDFSPFYTREYQCKRSESEELLIFRWFQLLEFHYQLFNVQNKHACFRDSEPAVIRPFQSVPHFYGCYKCGKYHFCELKRESCLVLADRQDKQKVCQYSGGLLHDQDNLEVANFNESRRVDSESYYYALPGYLNSSSTTTATTTTNGKRRHSTDGTGTNKRKRLESTRLLELLQEQSLNTTPTAAEKKKKKNKQAKRTSSDYRHYLKSIYELSLESLSEDSETEEGEPNAQEYDIEEEKEESRHHHNQRGKRRTNKENESMEEEEEICFEHSFDEEALLEKESDHENEEKSEVSVSLDLEDADDEMSHGEDDEIVYGENENGEGSYIKNYHNNIRYKNDYYRFLLPLVKKQQHHHHSHEEDQCGSFLDLYRRDIQEEDQEKKNKALLISEAEEEECRAPEAAAVLNKSICEKIDDETRNILSTLMKIHKESKKKEHALLTYFGSLIRNVTLLVYKSPVLDRLARVRSSKNQNQSTKRSISTIDLKSLENLQKNIDYHEYTLCPTKIVRSLLLDLFLEPFSLTDSYDLNIEIWHYDGWLRSFSQGGRNLMADYYHQATSLGPSSAQYLVFKKDLLNTSTLIKECLAFYQFCPTWIRAMIFK